MQTKEIIQSQYYAALAMLQQAVEKCPEALWESSEYNSPFWHIAYHVIFYTHLYLSPTRQDFIPWEKQRENYNYLGGAKKVPGELIAYSREEILAYLALCRGQVDGQVDAQDMEGESGFSWLPFGNLEKQIYNLRHLQQHTGELYERLGNYAGIELDWMGMKPAD